MSTVIEKEYYSNSPIEIHLSLGTVDSITATEALFATVAAVREMIIDYVDISYDTQTGTDGVAQLYKFTQAEVPADELDADHEMVTDQLDLDGGAAGARESFDLSGGDIADRTLDVGEKLGITFVGGNDTSLLNCSIQILARPANILR